MKFEPEICEENGDWIASVPMLPGCHSWGKTREDALVNIKEAAKGWIETGFDMLNTIPAAVELKRALLETVKEWKEVDENY